MEVSTATATAITATATTTAITTITTTTTNSTITTTATTTTITTTFQSLGGSYRGSLGVQPVDPQRSLKSVV